MVSNCLTNSDETANTELASNSYKTTILNRLFNKVQNSLDTDSKQDTDRSLWCGIYHWRPLCLQNLNNIQAFLVVACFISCLQASFSGYTSSQVTTLEKRFAIRSSVIGFINSCFEIGYISSVMYVSYVGSRGHVPFWISIGLFMMTTGAFIWSLPHFLFDGINFLTASNTSAKYQLCQWTNTSDTSKIISSASITHSRFDPQCLDEDKVGYTFLPIFMLAHFLIGAGSSPILTLIPPFIDDHVPSNKAPAMIGKSLIWKIMLINIVVINFFSTLVYQNLIILL